MAALSNIFSYYFVTTTYYWDILCHRKNDNNLACFKSVSSHLAKRRRATIYCRTFSIYRPYATLYKLATYDIPHCHQDLVRFNFFILPGDDSYVRRMQTKTNERLAWSFNSVIGFGMTQCVIPGIMLNLL